MKRRNLFYSIKDKKKISRLFSSASTIYSSNALMKSMDDPGEILPFGVLVAIPGKIRPVVKKNRLRRLVKETLFLVMKENLELIRETNSASKQIIIIPRESFELLGLEERKKEIKYLLMQLEK